MKGIVVDASIVASWLLEDEVSEAADWVIDQIALGTQVFAPALWLWEITSVLYNAERRKRIDKSHRDAALDRIERLPVTLVSAPTMADLRTLRLIVEKHQLTPYDAEYLRVAMELKLSLATQDTALIAAARIERIPLAQKTK
jgi:predicted nucleic acid-binding protein